MTMNTVPVLMYHHVNPHHGDIVTVTPRIFGEQMRYLRESGYKTLTVSELLSYARGEYCPKEKAVVVTFDDGWLDNYIYAFRVLEEYAIRATVFIVTDRTEGASEKTGQTAASVPKHRESKALIRNGEEEKVVLNWDLVRKMTESGLVEFYSHTKSHRKCDSLSEEELFEELGESKRVMEERLGRPCPYLCWPYGKYNDRAIEIAKELGYKALFTTYHGVVKAGSDPFAIKRIVVKDKGEWFKRRMVVYTNIMLSGLYLAIKKK